MSCPERSRSVRFGPAVPDSHVGVGHPLGVAPEPGVQRRGDGRPIVIGKALRFSGRRAFSLCHHGGEFPSSGLGRKCEVRPAGVCPAIRIFRRSDTGAHLDLRANRVPKCPIAPIRRSTSAADARDGSPHELMRITGVDFTRIDGMNVLTVKRSSVEWESI